MSGRARRKEKRLAAALNGTPGWSKDPAGGERERMPAAEPRIPRSSAVTLITVETSSPAEPQAAPPDADAPVPSSCGDGGWGKEPFVITSFRF